MISLRNRKQRVAGRTRASRPADRLGAGRLTLIVAIALVAAALSAHVTNAAPRSSGPPTLSLNPGSGAVGATVRATGTNLGFKRPGALSFGTTTVARFTTGPRGDFSASFVVPAASLGTVTVTASTDAARVVNLFLVSSSDTNTPPPSTSTTASTSTTSTSQPSSTSTSSTTSTSTTVPFTTTTTAPPTTTTAPSGSSVFGPASGRPFATSSAWNTPIGANPALDPNSAAQVAYLATGTGPGIADLYEYGVPVWDADASTPRYSVPCTKTWGTCPFSGKQVPIPNNAVASSGTDAAMVVIDWSTRTLYEFYQYSWNSGRPQAGWGAVGPYSGEGRDGEAGRVGNSTGAGISRLAGVVRAFEIRQGYIDHALVFSTTNACTGVYRYPAAKTDGRSTRSDCVPEGARLQLDPTIDVDSLAITPAEKMVARALQRFGAYVMDNGGANMAFIFETPSGESDPYCGAGLCRDYQRLNLPWNRMRVLRSWTGT